MSRGVLKVTCLGDWSPVVMQLSIYNGVSLVTLNSMLNLMDAG